MAGSQLACCYGCCTRDGNSGNWFFI